MGRERGRRDDCRRRGRPVPVGQVRGVVPLTRARRISPDAYETAALGLRDEAETTLQRTFPSGDVDVLVSISNLHSSLYATAGYPAVSVPLGLRSTGMPTGVTLIGRPGCDASLLGYAHAFELVTRLRRPPTTPSVA